MHRCWLPLPVTDHFQWQGFILSSCLPPTQVFWFLEPHWLCWIQLPHNRQPFKHVHNFLDSLFFRWRTPSSLNQSLGGAVLRSFSILTYSPPLLFYPFLFAVKGLKQRTSFPPHSTPNTGIGYIFTFLALAFILLLIWSACGTFSFIFVRPLAHTKHHVDQPLIPWPFPCSNTTEFCDAPKSRTLYWPHLTLSCWIWMVFLSNPLKYQEIRTVQSCAWRWSVVSVFHLL